MTINNFTPLPERLKKKISEKKRNRFFNSAFFLDEIIRWGKTLFLGLAIFFIIFVYNFLKFGSVTVSVLNRTIASTSVIIIGLSFALSGICYFWDFADRLIFYRKHLGVIGFFFVSLHVFISLFLLPGRSGFVYWLTVEFGPFIFGFAAFLIFLLMAIISNQFSIHKLGGKTWRRLMHFGYLAYIFIIIHIILVSGLYFRVFPPAFHIITIFLAILVLVLRVSIEFVKMKRQHQSQK